MKTETRQQIKVFLHKNGPTSPAHLAAHFQISNPAIHAQLRKLKASGEIRRLGTPPHTLYEIAEAKKEFPELTSDSRTEIENSFSYLSPTGQLLIGLPAFQEWVQQKKLEKTYKALAIAYVKTRDEVYSQLEASPFDTLSRLQSILQECPLTSAWIGDFYAIPQFGKTILGNYIHAIKTAFTPRLLRTIAEIIQPQIEKIIALYKVDYVIYYPHSIPRKIGFLPELKKQMKLPLPAIVVRKIFHGDTPVAQKSLSKIDERITNAKKTIFVEPMKFKAKNVLIIDDAIGSGASVSELARLLIEHFDVRQVHAYAAVGSYKGFDVISAV